MVQWLDMGKQKQWVEKVVLIVAGLALVTWTKGMVAGILATNIVGPVDVATVVGLVALFGAYKVHTRDW